MQFAFASDIREERESEEVLFAIYHVSEPYFFYVRII